MGVVKSTLRAYFAGVIDGDGYVTISRHRRTVGPRYGHAPVYYSVKIGLSQTDRQVRDLLVAAFGGASCEYQPPNPKHKRWFIWNAEGRTARAALKALLPFLVLKKQQAVVGLAFTDLMADQIRLRRRAKLPPARLTAEELTARHSLWLQMSALNQPRNRTRHSASAEPADRPASLPASSDDRPSVS